MGPSLLREKSSLDEGVPRGDVQASQGVTQRVRCVAGVKGDHRLGSSDPPAQPGVAGLHGELPRRQAVRVRHGAVTEIERQMPHQSRQPSTDDTQALPLAQRLSARRHHGDPLPALADLDEQLLGRRMQVGQAEPLHLQIKVLQRRRAEIGLLPALPEHRRLHRRLGE